MRKKSGLICVIIVIILQLCVPGGMVAAEIIENKQIVDNGIKVKLDIVNAIYHDEELTIDIDTSESWGKLYAQLVCRGDTGYYDLVFCEEKPADDFYIESADEFYFEFPVDYIKVKEHEDVNSIFMRKRTDDDMPGVTIGNVRLFDRACLEAYIYQGKVLPVKVYIDSLEADEYIEKLIQKNSYLTTY